MTVYDADWNPVASAVKGQGEDHFESLPRREQDTRRIVTCVNACAGLDDPAAAIEGARKALTAASSILWMAERYAEDGGSRGVEMEDYRVAEKQIRAALRTLTQSQEKKV